VSAESSTDRLDHHLKKGQERGGVLRNAWLWGRQHARTINLATKLQDTIRSTYRKTIV